MPIGEPTTRYGGPMGRGGEYLLLFATIPNIFDNTLQYLTLFQIHLILVDTIPNTLYIILHDFALFHVLNSKY